MNSKGASWSWLKVGLALSSSGVGGFASCMSVTGYLLAAYAPRCVECFGSSVGATDLQRPTQRGVCMTVSPCLIEQQHPRVAFKATTTSAMPCTNEDPSQRRRTIVTFILECPVVCFDVNASTRQRDHETTFGNRQCILRKTIV